MVPNVFLLDVSNHGTHPQSIGKTSQAMAVWRWRPPEEEIEAKALLGLQQNRNRNETDPLLLPLWNPHGQKVWAGAFPMPLPPPVTTTTLSRKENRLLLGCVFNALHARCRCCVCCCCCCCYNTVPKTKNIIIVSCFPLSFSLVIFNSNLY